MLFRSHTSFYLDDGKQPRNVRLKCYLINGETVPKYITINPDNQSRLIVAKSDSKTSSQEFEIIDTLNGRPISAIETQPTEKFAYVSDEQINMDRIKILLGGVKTDTEFKNYMDDNYMSLAPNAEQELNAINKKVQSANMGIQGSRYDSNLRLKNLKDTNVDIEDILDKKNRTIASEYNDIYHKLSKMQLDDYLNDYYYLTNLVKK